MTGLMGRVGYKAIGPDGLDKEIRGYIKNTQGNPVGILETIDRGSGYFDLKPRSRGALHCRFGRWF